MAESKKKATTKKTASKTAASKKTTSKKKAPKKNNFQKWLAYMKKYPPTGGAPIPDGSTIIVTARRKGGKYVPDRSYDALSKAFDEGIYPLLRVVTGDLIMFCPLRSYAEGVFVFEQISIEIAEDKKRTTTVWTYKYSPTDFKDSVDTSATQDVDLGYIDIGQ